ncbi:MAG: hypothetical protein CHACPFDD_01854 [Phycisphaerae bacterium]|nr:hypothetical protein [Phycisphaerae bacterium]
MDRIPDLRKLVVICMALHIAAAIVSAESAVPNGSFEQVQGDAPVGWSRARWAGEGTLATARVGRTDAYSVSIRSDQGADVSWACVVTVEINSRYRLSGWIKTEGVVAGSGKGALFNIHNIQPVQTAAITGTRDWTRVEVEFDTGFEDSVQVNCLLGGWGLSTGTAWFDDVALTLLQRGEVPAPRITVDAAATGEPISKYIYGQFIEHLGRCIYGGIWAEMLEDRKFFHPVGDADSPWKAFGAGNVVSMASERAFVGKHSPRVTLAGGAPAGIQQAGLALKSGMTYAGRVWLAGDRETAPIRVSLAWGPGAADRADVNIDRIAADFSAYPLSFRCPSDARDARFEVVGLGSGSLSIGAASLMPSDNVEGFRADTLALLKELDAPVYRWPGGNFVSGYEWRDGVGERDRRPPRKNPAWSGVEPNDVGIDEFMALCRLLETEAYIAVNTGLGSVENAVAQIEYVNGGAETQSGRLRAANGHAAPYGVRFFGIGNEMYGDWQLGHIPLAQYTARHNAFVDALRKVDPSFRPVGVGAVGDWSVAMLRECADRMEFISEHVYWQERTGLLAHVRQAPTSLRAIADAHRRYRRELPSLAAKNIRICQDEWNYWYGPHVFGELGTRYFMKDALGCAAALNEFARNSDLFFMANYAQTVNVIGAIKTSKSSAALETTGLVLKLYRRHFGVIPCRTETTPTVDALAAWSADRRRLTVAVVNPSLRPAEVGFELRGAQLAGTGSRWIVSDPDPLAYNDPDAPARITIREGSVRDVADVLSVEPCSVTLFALDVR